MMALPQSVARREREKRQFERIKQTFNGDGTIQSYVEVPEREPYVPLPGATEARRSTLVDAEGNTIQTWHIERPEEVARQEALQAALEAMREDLPRAPCIALPEQTMDDYLAVYPVGDHHLGMLAWAREVGTSYDTAIGEQLLAAATDHLMGTMLAATNCLIAFLGDYVHYDSLDAVTPEHKNQLDADSRKGKLIPAVVRSMRRMIEQAAQRHHFVHVIVEAGNHDPDASLWIQELLRVKYEDNPRITIDGSPARFHYYRFENNLIGTHHGDKAKMEDLPIIMANDRAEDWGNTNHRYIYTGHIHRRTALDVHGVSVESMRILPPADAYAHQLGYRPIRDMKAIIIHVTHGEVARYTFNPNMLETRA
jgi:hypothetical protein